MSHRVDIEAELRRRLIKYAVMNIVEHPAPSVGAEQLGPQFTKPGHRYMFQRGIELPLDMARRTCVGGGSNQLGGDAAEDTVENELGPAAEVERQLLDPDLGAFGGIDRVQLALVDRNAAGRQKFAVQPAWAQGEVEPRAQSLALREVDPGPQIAGNPCLDVPQ